MKKTLKNILQSSMRNRKLLQLLVITALIISSAKVDLFAQSSNPQPKMRLCTSDEIANCFSYNIFNKSNPRFIYMLNKETKDSLYFVQIDVTNLTITNRKTVHNNINYKTLLKPLSPDMKWCAYLHTGIEKQGCVIQSLENPSIKKHLFDNKIFYGYDFDTVSKRIFLAYPTPLSGQLSGAIFSANYDNDDIGEVLIKGVTGERFLYDYKRNHIITVDYEENPDNKDGYRSLIQFFDANTGELVKQVIPYESEFNDGKNANPHIYRIKMLKGGKKLCMFVSNYIENVLTLDLETYELKKIKSFEKNPVFGSYKQEYFYNSDSLMFCTEYLNSNKDSLGILVVNINTNQIVMNKIIRGEQKMNDLELVEYMLENYGLFITYDPETEGCIKIYDLNDLEDNLSDIQTNIQNEIENIYPNPSNGFVQINLNQEILTPISIEISNFNGLIVQTISNQIIQNQTIQLNLSSLNTGQYFIKVNSINFSKTFKLIKGL